MIHLTQAEFDRLQGRRRAKAAAPAKAPKPRKPPAPKARATTVKAAPRVKVVAAGPATRGPWMLAVDYLGRPPTFNGERRASRSGTTMRAVRAANSTWQEAFVAEVRRAGVPRLGRVFVTFQPFYNSNVVPDPDGLPATTKAAIDALVVAGVLPNDRREELNIGYHTLPAFTDGGPPRLVMTVHPMP